MREKNELLTRCIVWKHVASIKGQLLLRTKTKFMNFVFWCIRNSGKITKEKKSLQESFDCNESFRYYGKFDYDVTFY